jgi:hypothetical protein
MGVVNFQELRIDQTCGEGAGGGGGEIGGVWLGN